MSSFLLIAKSACIFKTLERVQNTSDEQKVNKYFDELTECDTS